ncbi:MAG: PDZ domain-containing protein [Gemmataceae bacterium]|nr:PDZ domain-containing protein [Gemmataceae bacterium]
MHRVGLPCVVITLALALTAPTQGDEKTALKQALALQEVMQQAIEAAEPSIACVLVSRSDAYQRYSQGPASDNAGKLGAFDVPALERHPLYSGLGEKERATLRRKLDLADPRHVPESFGSGVVLDERGLVLTNYHVVQGAVKIFVRLPDHQGSYADIHAADPRSDLAVLRLLDGRLTLRAIKLGDGGQAKRGQFVLSIANPFAAGFRDGKPSASWGIISNVRRRAPGSPREEERARTLHHHGTLLQTDARLNLGCSGGALIDLHGQLIGLTSATAALAGGETPGGFAIPIDAGLRRILDMLKRGEEVEYGFLGVGVDEHGERTEGVALEQVTRGSPADLAGLKPRHVILSVNSTAVHEADELFLALGTLMAGSKVMLEVRKPGGAREKVEVTLARFHVPGKAIASEKLTRPFVRGLRVDYTSILVQVPHPATQHIPPGVLVDEVQPGTSAATVKLRSGEIITHVNGRAVNDPAAFYREILGRGGPVELTLASENPGKPAPKVTLN